MTPDLKTAIQMKRGDPTYYEDRLKQALAESERLLDQFEKEAQKLLNTQFAKIEAIKKELDAEIESKVMKATMTVIEGRRGPQGEKGDSIVGPKGEKGDPSTIPGPMGPKPVAGVDYPIPKNGRDGIDGQSIVGPAGRDGKDGSPDQPLEIAAKLNTTNESVEMSVIKGLKTYLSNVTRAMKEKGAGKSGGGMGNVVHQSVGVDSSTTTVTTTQKIAAAGYALWVYYNGQLIARGVGYTVGADHRTLTLLFTPQDSTAIDITYIRG